MDKKIILGSTSPAYQPVAMFHSARNVRSMIVKWHSMGKRETMDNKRLYFIEFNKRTD